MLLIFNWVKVSNLRGLAWREAARSRKRAKMLRRRMESRRRRKSRRLQLR